MPEQPDREQQQDHRQRLGDPEQPPHAPASSADDDRRRPHEPDAAAPARAPAHVSGRRRRAGAPGEGRAEPTRRRRRRPSRWASPEPEAPRRATPAIASGGGRRFARSRRARPVARAASPGRAEATGARSHRLPATWRCSHCRAAAAAVVTRGQTPARRTCCGLSCTAARRHTSDTAEPLRGRLAGLDDHRDDHRAAAVARR